MILRIDIDEKWLLDYARDVITNTEVEIVMVFDVGAATGRWTLYTYELLYKTPELRYHLFEPTYEQFQELTRSYGEMPNVALNNFALSDRSGLTQIHVEPFNEHSSLLGLEGDVRTIPVFTVDDYCDFHRIERISLLKIDVEGNEPQVIAGARRMLAERRIDCMQFEYGGRWDQSLAEQVRIVKSYGYRVFEFNADQKRIVEVETGTDDFGYRNLLAVVDHTSQPEPEPEKDPLMTPAWEELLTHHTDAEGRVLWPDDGVGGPPKEPDA